MIGKTVYLYSVSISSLAKDQIIKYDPKLYPSSSKYPTIRLKTLLISVKRILSSIVPCVTVLNTSLMNFSWFPVKTVTASILNLPAPNYTSYLSMNWSSLATSRHWMVILCVIAYPPPEWCDARLTPSILAKSAGKSIPRERNIGYTKGMSRSQMLSLSNVPIKA